MKRSPLKRGTSRLKRSDIKRKPDSKRWSGAIGEQPRKRLRARSKTNSNRHEDLKFRREYMAENQWCEMLNLFPKDHGWSKIPGCGQRVFRAGFEPSTDPHHILWGQARRHDIRANLIAICREAHDFCHKFKNDGLILALEAKRRKGELDWTELDRISGKNVRGWLSTKRPTFRWVLPYYEALIGDVPC